MLSAIKIGATISYCSILISIAISFCYTPWMIRKVGVADYGLYGLVSSFISYFMLDFGLKQAVQRFIATYRAEQNERQIGKILGITFTVYLLIDTFILVVLFCLYFFLGNIFKGLTDSEIIKLQNLYIIAGSLCVCSFVFKPMSGAMMAYEYFVEEKTLETVERLGIVLLCCIALWLGGSINVIVLITGSCSLFISFVRFYIFVKKTKLTICWSYFDKTELKKIFSFSTWTFISGIAQRMRFALMPTVLGILSNTKEIAVFSLGMALEGYVYTFASGINGLFLPKVSRLCVSGDNDGIMNLMIKIGRLQLYLFGLIYSGFIIYGRHFLKLWTEEHLANVYSVLVLLILSNTVSLTQRIAEDLVYIKNKVRFTSLLTLTTSLCGLIIAFVISPKWGAIGCAFGTCVGLCVYLVILNIYYHRILGLNMLRFFKECHLRVLPGIVLLVVIWNYCASNYCVIDSWLKFGVHVGLYTAVYGAFCFLLLFNKDEKQLLNYRRH